ncbi:MAG: hypothetical protein PGN16_04225 [Sphingomonas phyllosphaerae]|uniref:hypothetical protein n=1 Tax=Sphingomonas phyllosphaerae TaxID=257003 RepID=UPI002FF6C138
MIRIIAAALLLIAQPVQAQVIAESYRNAAGQVQDGIGITNIAPIRSTSVPTSGAVASANAFQSALSASPARKGCALYNTSTAAMLVYLGAPAGASAAASIPVPAGGSFNCGSFQGLVLTDQISVTSATAGATFVVVSQ